MQAKLGSRTRSLTSDTNISRSVRACVCVRGVGSHESILSRAAAAAAAGQWQP